MKSIIHSFLLRTLGRFLRATRFEVISAAFFLFAVFLLWTTFKYTVFQNNYYANLANRQQSQVVKNPVSRGTIYSNNDPIGVFATSTDLPDLAVDPKALGSKERLVSFLVDTTYLDLCSKQVDEKCQENVFAFAKIERPPNFSANEDGIRTIIRSEITKRIEKQFVDFVLVKESLSPDEISAIQSLSHSGISLVLGNLYVNPTKFSDDERAMYSAKFQGLFNISKENADFFLSKRSVQYVKILRRMNLATKDFIDARMKEEKEVVAQGRAKEQDTVLPFLILEPHPTRFYPEKEIGGQLTGFVDGDGSGRYGIEGYYNDELQGQE